MNLIFIDREFKRLETLEEYIDYEYEPKSKLKMGKRNHFTFCLYYNILLFFSKYFKIINDI